MEFASDNTAGAAPEIMAALARVNEGPARSYGADAAMDRVRAMIRETFEAPEAAVYLVATGTAANALSLACYCPPWAAVYAHEAAHVEMDECGAPEFFIGGGKIVRVPGADGKMTPDSLRAAIAATPQGFVHGIQRGVVTVTNVTEAGTVYTAAEVAALSAVARSFGLPVHMDGARFANALVATNAAPAELTWRAGVDVLSFGGTKNGCLGVEAVVLFDPAKAWEFELRRKRGGHLFSKHRYLSAQMEAYMADGLWRRLAKAANDRAAALESVFAGCAPARLMHPRQANMIFAALPRGLHRRAEAAGAHYYYWPGDPAPDGPEDEPLGARFVTAWSTIEADIEAFARALAAA